MVPVLKKRSVLTLKIAKTESKSIQCSKIKANDFECEEEILANLSRLKMLCLMEERGLEMGPSKMGNYLSRKERESIPDSM